LPTGTTASTQTSTDNSTKIATTAFVQLASSAGTIDATTSSKGKLKLAGDLAGTADLPTIATSAISSAKILDGNIATVDLADAAVTDAKISAVAGSKVTGNITGNAANVSGTVAVANGGTGANTLASNQVLLGNGTNAIQTVAPGTSGNVLMSNGTTWISSSNTSENVSHSIGELYGGGKVFFIYDGGKHGLIAALTDQSSNAKWDLSKGNETRARANGIGAGIRNTTTIIVSSEISQRKSSKDNDWSFDSEDFAAVICNEYSKSETVNFAADKYWSSSESDEDKAWTINFSTSSNSPDDKTNKNRVRAIRNF
jgi:hypothetical protein